MITTSAPRSSAAAIGCALVFAVLNTCLVAVAARLAEPDGRLADQLWDRERTVLDLTEICVGILVTIACGLSPLLLLIALPPALLLQRSLMHAQLTAAARTDAKTGLLNAAKEVQEHGTFGYIDTSLATPDMNAFLRE